MLTETYAEISKVSIFSSVASNMKSNKIAEDLTSLVPDFATALEKVVNIQVFVINFQTGSSFCFIRGSLQFLM